MSLVEPFEPSPGMPPTAMAQDVESGNGSLVAASELAAEAIASMPIGRKGAAELAGAAMDKKKKNIRSIWRTTVFFILLGVSYAVWSLAILPSTVLSLTKRYDPIIGLELTVSACDVDFVTSTMPTIKYNVLWKGNSATWTNLASVNELGRGGSARSCGCCAGLRHTPTRQRGWACGCCAVCSVGRHTPD